MNYTDLVPKSYTSKSVTGSISGSDGGTVGSWSGSQDSMYDANDTTYYQYQAYHNGDGHAEASFTFDDTWTYPVTIYSCRMKGAYLTYGGNYKISKYRFIIYLKVSSSWTSVYDTGLITGALGSNSWATVNFDQTVSTGWANVTGIRGYMYGYSYSYEGDRKQYVKLQNYQLEVRRQKYEELFRVKKSSSTAQIGSFENSGSYKLKVYKGSSVVSVPLLNTADPMASPVRVYDGSSVKSLPLAD